MKIKKIILLTVIFVFVLSVFAVADTATLTYSIPGPVVSDVKFDINLQMNADNNVKNIKLYTKSGSSRVDFITATRADWLTNMPAPDVRLLDSNKVIFYSVGPDGSKNQSAANKKVATITAKIKGIAGDTILLDTSRANEVGIYPQGTFSLSGGGAVPVTPALSACNDGVVGYFDNGTTADSTKVNNGIKDTGEKDEVCDKKLFDGVTGCSDNCTYIKIDWTCPNQPGDVYTSSKKCTKKDSLDAFVDRIKKILAKTGSHCYPDDTHPNKVYCDLNTLPAALKKTTQIGHVAAALAAFFTAS